MTSVAGNFSLGAQWVLPLFLYSPRSSLACSCTYTIERPLYCHLHAYVALQTTGYGPADAHISKFTVLPSSRLSCGSPSIPLDERDTTSRSAGLDEWGATYF
jgi:hypothetical protein